MIRVYTNHVALFAWGTVSVLEGKVWLGGNECITNFGDKISWKRHLEHREEDRLILGEYDMTVGDRWSGLRILFHAQSELCQPAVLIKFGSICFFSLFLSKHFLMK
jgi:hypothetical protein